MMHGRQGRNLPVNDIYGATRNGNDPGGLGSIRPRASGPTNAGQSASQVKLSWRVGGFRQGFAFVHYGRKSIVIRARTPSTRFFFRLGCPVDIKHGHETFPQQRLPAYLLGPDKAIA